MTRRLHLTWATAPPSYHPAHGLGSAAKDGASTTSRSKTVGEICTLTNQKGRKGLVYRRRDGHAGGGCLVRGTREYLTLSLDHG